MRFTHLSINTLIITVALFALPFVVHAQEAAPAGAAMEAPDAATLDKFVIAFNRVSALQQTFTNQLAEVESREAAQALQQEAQQEMIKAVEESGMTVQEYNSVATQIDQDPALRDKVLQRLDIPAHQ